MSTYGAYEPVKLIEPNPLGGEVWLARQGAEQGFVIKTLTDAGLPPTEARRRVESFLEQARIQKSAGQGGPGWAPIFTAEAHGDGAAFYVTRFYPRSLQWLIDARRRLRPLEAKNIALRIIEALGHVERAHGNLRATNILLENPADLSRTGIALADPAERAGDRADDFRHLGEMLYHLITGREFRAGDFKAQNAHFWFFPYDGLEGKWASLVRGLGAGDVEADPAALQHAVEKLPIIYNWKRIIGVLATATAVTVLSAWIIVMGLAHSRWKTESAADQHWLGLIKPILPDDRPDILRSVHIDPALGASAGADDESAKGERPHGADRQNLRDHVAAIRDGLESAHADCAGLLQEEAADLPDGAVRQQLSQWSESFRAIDSSTDQNLLNEYWSAANPQTRALFHRLHNNRATLQDLSPRLLAVFDRESHLADKKTLDQAVIAIGDWNKAYEEFDGIVHIKRDVVKSPNLSHIQDAIIAHKEDGVLAIANAILPWLDLHPETERTLWAQGVRTELAGLSAQVNSQSDAQIATEIQTEQDKLAGYVQLPWDIEAEKQLTVEKPYFVDREAAIRREIELKRLDHYLPRDPQLAKFWNNLRTAPEPQRRAAMAWLPALDASAAGLSQFSPGDHADLTALAQYLTAERTKIIIQAFSNPAHVLEAAAYLKDYQHVRAFSTEFTRIKSGVEHHESLLAQNPLGKQLTELKNDSLFAMANRSNAFRTQIAQWDLAAAKEQANADQIQANLRALAAWEASPPKVGDLQQLRAYAATAKILNGAFPDPDRTREFQDRLRQAWTRTLAAATNAKDVLDAYDAKSSCFVGGEKEAQELLSPRIWYNVQLSRLQQAADTGSNDEDKLARKVIDAGLAAGVDVSKLQKVLNNHGRVVPSSDKSKPELAGRLKHVNDTGDVQIFQWKLDRQSPPAYLQFIKVPSNGGDAYVAQTEVSIGLFARMLLEAAQAHPDKPQIWTNVLEMLPKHLTDDDDDRTGPRTWELTGGRPSDLQPAEHWQRDIEVSPPLDGQYYSDKLRVRPTDAATGRNLNPQYGIGAPIDDIEQALPVQQISARLALYWAAMLGCRPPTIAEWKAAVAQSIGATVTSLPTTVPQWRAAFQKFPAYPHLRTQLWCDELAYARNPQWPTLADVGGPDAGIFRLREDDARKSDDNPNPLADEDHDGKFWFNKVHMAGAQPESPERFYDLIGNVSEFVLPDAAALDAAPNQSADPEGLLRLVDGYLAENKVCVIGGSALSASENVAEPLPVDSRDNGKLYSDVGIRLAFKAPQISYAEQLAEAVRGLSYLISAPAR